MEKEMSDEERTILEVTGKIPMSKAKTDGTLYGGRTTVMGFVVLSILGLAALVMMVIYLYNNIYGQIAQYLIYIILACFALSYIMIRKSSESSFFTYLFIFTAPGAIGILITLTPWIPLSPHSALLGALGIFLAYFVLSKNGVFG